MSKKKKLNKFIEDNALDFTGSGSGLNSSCVIICGYADFIGVDDSLEVYNAIIEESTIAKTKKAPLLKEVKRVFDFTYAYNYGTWWKREIARKMYKF